MRSNLSVASHFAPDGEAEGAVVVDLKDLAHGRRRVLPSHETARSGKRRATHFGHDSPPDDGHTDQPDDDPRGWRGDRVDGAPLTKDLPDAVTDRRSDPPLGPRGNSFDLERAGFRRGAGRGGLAPERVPHLHADLLSSPNSRNVTGSRGVSPVTTTRPEIETPGGSCTRRRPASIAIVVPCIGAPSGTTTRRASPSPARKNANPWASVVATPSVSFSRRRTRRAFAAGFPAGTITSISSAPRLDAAPSAGSLSGTVRGLMAPGAARRSSGPDAAPEDVASSDGPTRGGWARDEKSR